MKVSGSILLDKRGAFPHVHEHNINYAVDDFVFMLEEASKCKDKLYYDSEEWELFHAHGFNQKNDYWKGARSIAYEKLFLSSNRLFTPLKIVETDKFENKPTPRTLGGFKCVGCPKSDYIYDKSTIDKWHYQWFWNNPDKIDWSNSVNDIFPCYDKVIEILRQELQKLKGNPDSISGLEHLEKQYITSVDIDRLSAQEVVSKFYSLIMDHKAESGERISYAKEIGSKICELNYYHHEQELEDLNKCNQQIVKIYSIKRDNKYQFLSIDKKHGRFELCDNKGDHLCELMFDGTKVENSQEANHSILYINDWERTCHK
ncbi:MAG: hypothetical protein K6F94_03890 [Bacteroidaceae bacterium]|nr:hypothetical protein [Bacteroidaceae bacterium]